MDTAGHDDWARANTRRRCLVALIEQRAPFRIPVGADDWQVLGSRNARTATWPPSPRGREGTGKSLTVRRGSSFRAVGDHHSPSNGTDPSFAGRRGKPTLPSGGHGAGRHTRIGVGLVIRS